MWSALACVGLREVETNGHTEVVARPAVQGNPHDAYNKVQAAQRTVCLAGGTRTLAVPSEPVDRRTGFFLGRVVKDNLHDRVLRDKWGCLADDRAPEGPAFGVKETPEEYIEPGKVLHRGGSSEP